MKYLYFVFTVLLLTSCGDSASDITVDEYIEMNSLVTQELDKGVHIVIHEPGNNVKPNINSTIVVNYEGRLTNGDVFDSNDNITFQLANLIEGWRIGLKEIGEGGSCTLIIPPEVGYGSSGSGPIPGNAVLVFDMDLIEVK